MLGCSEMSSGCCNAVLSAGIDLHPRCFCRLRRFKALVDAAVFLDVPQYVPPEPQILPQRAAAQAMQSRFGAQWDPACAAAQLVLPDPTRRDAAACLLTLRCSLRLEFANCFPRGF